MLRVVCEKHCARTCATFSVGKRCSLPLNVFARLRAIMQNFNDIYDIYKFEDSQPGTYQDSWRAGKGTFLSRLAMARLKNGP
jgi:hypothetical protein